MKYPNAPTITTDIYSVLYDLGIKAETTSFFHTAYAVRLAAEDPQKLLLVTKWLYPEVARHYHTSWHAVERSIRRAVNTAWAQHPEKLALLAKQKLLCRPTPTQFLSIISNKLTHDYIA